MQTEVFGFGRMPLAFSARCFTARHQPAKDDCRFSCIDHPDGSLLLRASKRISGAQWHPNPVGQGLQPDRSGGGHAGLGVEVLRLSLQSQHMVEVITLV